ncbi:Plexin-A4 [Acropora cervicornis]|uniref:Plexin-A4 n=1 Tax=Acropora cervicornis TaxID=6130 RepID=A0AAD9PVT2_ACRCE|nr:Plexin-A4 [Acropora cervicornis]
MDITAMLVLALIMFSSFPCSLYGKSHELKLSDDLVNMDFDNITGNIFVGGKNVLLKLSPSLVVLNRISTGPELDYINCPVGECDGQEANNTNKVLLVYYHNRTKRFLVTCGSIKHGQCQLRNIDSLKIESRKNSVVSNSPLPAVAIIAPVQQKHALYVGTSWDDKYNKDGLAVMPKLSVSTRNIDGKNSFELSANAAFDGYSFLQFTDGDYNYRVKYIYGFSSGNFNYFVTVQETTESFAKRFEPKVLKSFITRICQQDISYKFYVELPLECKSRGRSFNIAQSGYLTKPGGWYYKFSSLQASDDVLVVTFFESTTGWEVGPSQNSVICLYPVKEINKAMASDQQKCVNSTYEKLGLRLGLPWLAGGNEACSNKGSLRITPEYCPIKTSENNDYNPYRGKESLCKDAILEYSNGTLTAVTAMPYHNDTVIFVGTYKGQLLKLSVRDGTRKVEPYKKLMIGTMEVRQIKLSADFKYLMVLSVDKVTKVPVEDQCNLSSTCRDCAQLNNPFCGWCTLHNKCSRREQCHQVEVHPFHFSTNESDCVQFTSVTPDKIPLGLSVTTLNLSLSNLPPSNSYKCYINKKERPSQMIDHGFLQCSTPPGSELPSVSSETGDVFVDLELFSMESNQFFIRTKVAFYSCPAIQRCRHCAEGRYDCSWCTYLQKCTNDGTTDCPGEYIHPVQKDTISSSGCPLLKANTVRLIPVGIETNITIPGQNLPLSKSGASYKCNINIDGRTETTDAIRTSSSQLICSPKQYSYTGNVERKLVGFAVTFINEEVLVPDSFTAYLYKCWVSRKDCSTCHSDVIAEPALRCGWCRESTPSCVVKDACVGDNKWIPSTSDCLTTPNITKVWPLAGPLRGGTEVEIQGYDLGKKFADIRNSVTVAGHPCYPDHKKYQPSKRIVCNTSLSVEDDFGPVVVTVSGFKGKSTQMFYYRNPEPQDFNPKKGPQSGGTNVTITGHKMDTGRFITVQVAGRPCKFNRTRVSDSSVSCITSPPPSRIRRLANGSTGVIISFDGFTPAGPEDSFVYTPDPTITAIKPDIIFLGGGLELRISGTYLDSIQKPKIYIIFPSSNGSQTTAVQECHAISSSLMTCRAPRIPVMAENVSQVVAAFKLDGLSFESNNTKLTVVPNPRFEKFERVYVLQGNSLILQAVNLEVTLRNQIIVTVGVLRCDITSIDKNQLVCLAPLKKDQTIHPTDDLYAVEVDIGFLNFPIGKLKYDKEETEGIPLIVWIGVGVGIAVALIIFIVVICWCRRSRRKQKEHFKSLELQLNNLESKVARECRDAFAELQTDVTDLTSDLSLSGMPILDFKTYALHVLFPGLDDHPVVHNKAFLGENWEKGLRQFSQLIFNKKFVLVFIRTLESQNTFQMKDRCNVASLLMVALQGKMEYATEILKDLLCELIRKSVAKSHPKLLLRRTEAVAEKMLTNWLAFSMYDFLKNEAGEALFMLFKAVKQQTEKGPVDAVTGEARYSLSEDKLLRQAVDFKPLNVRVSFDGNPAVTVMLLDCDTITQAKSKILDVIFKNSPFSSRPQEDALGLEWDQSSGRVLPLRDDDSQSLIDGEWRKINTLRHYQVTENASFRLVTGQRYFYSSTDSGLNKKNLLRVGFSPGGSYSPLAVGTLQQFVDRLFHTVFMRYRRGGSSLPPVVKFLFDLLDAQAKELNLTDPEVLHTWKNNSLPLRFWINTIKNPNFIFDVCKSAIVDSCLSVVAQDSPSNKLLYAREIPGYRQEVERFYSDIQASPALTPQELSAFLADVSKEHGQEFNADHALQELYEYVKRYQDQLQEALEESELSSLASKLEHVIATISDD